MRRLFIIGILLLSLVSSVDSTAGYTNDCSGWARELHAKPGASSMHMLGCRYSSGAWRAASNTCNTYARQYARRGYRGYDVFYKISPKGCAMDNYGKYYVVRAR